ncbi:hypothetical protein [Kitasatospora sp. NPDC008115]|uniref:hypothetical protein n=1 Tax=Kitasatospora sp. NPDC008115 TaxID=3364022 RepID=UPI0036EF2281
MRTLSRVVKRGVPMIGALASLLCASVIASDPAEAAEAAIGDALCPLGSQVVTFSPGITNTPAVSTITYNVNLGTCVSLTTPSLTSGTSSGSASLTFQCSDLLSTSTGSQDITWNTGQTSTFSYTRTFSLVNGNSVTSLNGSITSGLFNGDTASLVITDRNLDLLACQSPGGLTHIDGTTVFYAG